MRVLIQYTVSFFWGLATPALAGVGAEYARDLLWPSGPPQGHATPMDFFLLLVGVALLCAFLFLVFDVIWSRFVLSDGSPRVRHFIFCLLLYLLMCVGGWFAGVWLAGWLGL
ncbi:MAG: hypothetical protein IK136_04075 [Oscillospiraceae bacterium]|nr:hypothetical protein [Oscillospiraceae bacterium]